MQEQYFSIVTICRNAENEIKETIESIIQQEYSQIEYIIIDGASTDNTCDIIDTYKEQIQKKCKSFVFITEKDKGISDAFNKGIKKASGDIIGLINAGDTLLPNALKQLNKNFPESIDIVYGNTVCIDKQNNISYLRQKPENLDLSKIASKGLIFTHQSAFVRKRLYDEIGMYDENFRIIMDEELFIRFYKAGATFKYIDCNLVSMLAGGVSSTPSKRILKEHLEIGKKYGGVNRIALIAHYIIDIPIRMLKKMAKKNKFLWNMLIGKKRRL